MQILVPLITALVPIIITPGLLFHFDITPKVIVLLYGVSVILAFGDWNWVGFTKALRSRAIRWFCILLGLQLVWFLVATALSQDRSLSVDGSEWRRLGAYTYAALVVFTFFALLWLRVPGNLTVLLRWSIVSGTLISVYAIAQYAGFDPLLPRAAYHSGEGPFTIVRPPGTMGHADYLASYLIFVTFAGLALSRLENTAWRRYGSLAGAGIASVAIILSGTRGALAALICGFVVLAAFDRDRLRSYSVAVVSVLIVIAALVISPAGDKLRARVHWSIEDPYGGARVLLWRDTLRMSWSSPAVGFGPEAFIVRFPQHQSLALARAYPDFFHESPHNALLDALAGQGIPGTLLLLSAWCVAMYAGLKAGARRHPAAAAVLGCGVALLFSHQFAIFVPPTAMVFLLVQAMSFALTADVDERTPPRPRGLWRYAAVLPALLFSIEATRLIVADGALRVAQQRIATVDVEGARAAYRLAEMWGPAGGRADLYYSRSMASMAGSTPIFQARLDAWSEAMRAGALAAEHSEQRQNAWYSLAALFATQNNPASVERALRMSIAWAPHWFKPHWALAELYRANGRRQDAIVEAALALECDGGKNPEVISTWKLVSANATR